MAGKTYETSIRISGALDSKFKSVTGGAAAALKKLQAQAQKLTKAREAARAFDRLQTELKQAQVASAAAGHQSDKLRRAVERKSIAVAKASERLQKMGVDTSRLAAEEKRLGEELGRTQSKMKATGFFAKAQLGKRFARVREETVSLARSMAKLGAVVGSAAGYAVVKFSQFEKGMAEVSTLVDASTTDMPALSKEIRKLATEFGGDHVTEAKALYSTISAGISDSGDAMRVLTVANKLAVAGVTDVDTAVNGLTTAMNAFGLKADDATKVSDAMITTMRLAKTTIPELSDFMFQAAPTAAALGVGFDDLNSAVVAMTLQGVPTSVAFTRIRASLDAMVRPTGQLNSLWGKLGFKSGTAAIKAKGLGWALTQVRNAAKGDAGQLLKLLGSTEAIQAAMVIGGTGAESYRKALGEIEQSAGATDTAFEKMRQSLDFQAKVVRAKATDIAITIGSKLAPIVGRALTRISAWVDENKDRIERWATQAADWIETRLIPALKQFAEQVWPIIRGLGSMTQGVAKAVGGFGNLALIVAGIRLLPLASSVVSLAGGLVSAGRGAAAFVGGLSGIQATASTAFAALGPLVAALTAGVAAGRALDEWAGISDAWGDIGNPAIEAGTSNFQNWVRGQELAQARAAGGPVTATVAPTINVQNVEQAKAAIRDGAEKAAQDLDRQMQAVDRSKQRRSFE